MYHHSKTLIFDDWRYAVFAYDDSIKKFVEFVYTSIEECEVALKSFDDFSITAFICVSHPDMEGKISELLLQPGTCFNA